eukprot:scaffold19665_cov89-Skeletonema_menzelii.AAC.1
MRSKNNGDARDMHVRWMNEVLKAIHHLPKLLKRKVKRSNFAIVLEEGLDNTDSQRERSQWLETNLPEVSLHLLLLNLLVVKELTTIFNYVSNDPLRIHPPYPSILACPSPSHSRHPFVHTTKWISQGHESKGIRGIS